MNRAACVCLLVGSVSFGLWARQAPSSSEGAVRMVVAHYMEARNEKKTDSLPRLFTPDADQLVSTGEWRKGLDNLIQGAMASSKKEKGSSSIAIERVRFLDPDVALVDGRYETTSANGTIRKMWTTLLLKRAQGEWRIAAIRNMLPSPQH